MRVKYCVPDALIGWYANGGSCGVQGFRVSIKTCPTCFSTKLDEEIQDGQPGRNTPHQGVPLVLASVRIMRALPAKRFGVRASLVFVLALTVVCT